MPITSSAKKALRQSVKRHEQNLLRKKTLNDTLRKYKKTVEEKNTVEATKLLPMVYKVIDKTAKIGVITKNKASRLKSRLTRKLTVVSK